MVGTPTAALAGTVEMTVGGTTGAAGAVLKVHTKFAASGMLAELCAPVVMVAV